MPLARFDTGAAVTGDTIFGARSLIPGVEPGGSKVGQPLKPALLIKDCDFILRTIDPDADQNDVLVTLELSKEQDMDPAQRLYVGSVHASSLDTTQEMNSLVVSQNFKDQGTIWAPAYVSGRIFATAGFPTSVRVQVRLRYELVMIPWVDWFVAWEWLDNITTGDEEY